MHYFFKPHEQNFKGWRAAGYWGEMFPASTASLAKCRIIWLVRPFYQK